MDVIGSLPPWVIVLLAVLVAGILLAQNIGWLLAARAMLDAQRRRQRGENERAEDGPRGGTKRPPRR